MDKDTLRKFLPYSSNIDARCIYRALEKHFKVGLDCTRCTCYHQYGLMLIRGDYGSFYEHIMDISCEGKEEVFARFDWSLGQITDSGLITIEKREERLHEMVFTQLAPKEVMA